jgi:hypothetical protein
VKKIFVLVAAFVLSACPQPKPIDACTSQPCGPGVCSAINDQAFCLCHPGFVLQNNTCVSDSMASCSPNPCMGGKTCSVVSGAAQCDCPSGLVDRQGQCVSPLCANINCGSVPHQTVCAVVDVAPVCTCEAGYVPTATGCSELPVYDCSAQHSGGSGDLNEPDECPSLATMLTPGLVQQHTFAPSGDVDWFSVRALPGHVVEISVNDLVGASGLDVFKADGLTVFATNHAGANPSLRVVVPATEADPLFIRISPLDPSSFGVYEVVTRDLGVDDLPDTVATASLLAANATFQGEVQFEGDVDVVRLETTAGDAWRFELTQTSAVEVDVLAEDGTRLFLLTASAPVAAVVADGARLSLRAHGRFSNSVGTFSVSTAALGPDDHGDDAARATAVTATGLSRSANWERANDLDVLSLQVTSGHAYALSCASTRGCRIVVTTSSGSVLANNASTTTANSLFTPSTSGTVYLAFSAYTAGSAAWSWTLTDTSIDDVGDTVGTADSIALGTARGAALQTTSDHDFFTFTSQAGRGYQVTCSSTVSYVCAMAVRDSSGTLLGSTTYGYGSPTTVSFTTSAATTVSIDVSGSASGAYSLQVVDLGADDHGNTAATATAIQLGVATSGSIQLTGDVDVFSLSATAGSLYVARCATSVSYLCAMTVRDVNGTTVASTSYGAATSVGFSAATSGDFTVEVRAQYSGYIGAYTVTVSSAGVDDFGDTTAAAGPITVGTNVNGNTQYAYDKDVMSFTATSNHLYVATCSTSVSYLCAMTIRNASGTSVATASYGTNTTATFLAAAGGTYTIEHNPASTTTGAWVLRVADSGTDDFGDTVATAGTGTIGTTINGNTQFTGDKDVIAFTTTPDRLYRVNCSSTASYGCTMIIRDAAQATVVSTSYATSQSTGFKATSAGPYTVEMRNYYGYTGTWTLTLTDVGADDHGDTAAAGTLLTVGAAATAGNVQVVGDKDVFVFNAVADTVYRFSCTSSASYVCSLIARTPALVTLSTSSYGTNTVVAFKASTTGQHSVEVSGYSTYLGAYSVMVNTLTDDHGDTPGTGSTLVTGVTRTGNLDYTADVDYFAVSLTAGTTYTVTVTATSIANTLYDPTLGVVTLTGRSFTATSTGTYYLRVAASTYSTGPYSVLIQ